MDLMVVPLMPSVDDSDQRRKKRRKDDRRCKSAGWYSARGLSKSKYDRATRRTARNYRERRQRLVNAKFIGVWIPNDLLALLTDAAHDQGVSLSEMMRRAAVDFGTKVLAEAQERKRKRLEEEEQQANVLDNTEHISDDAVAG